jgi:predicted enzyme related to lactoylglutathione lyase
MSNALNWFEIPVTDLARAKKFYDQMLQVETREESMSGMTMAIFPYQEGGVGGALIVGEPHVPSTQGTIVYLGAGDDLPGALTRAEALYAPNLRGYPVRLVGLLRHAVTEQRKARFDYAREDGAASIRTVWPLGLFYWGSVWTLVAWCELRSDHRSFRLDRMTSPEILAEPFSLQTGQTLQDFLDKIGARSVAG